MIKNIQILRALAALSVVVYHIWQKTQAYNIGIDYNLSFLSSGVDLFFIISGFIMVYIQDRKKRTSFEFLKERCIRIIPLYYFFTFLITSVFIISPQVFNERVFHVSDLLSSLFFVNFLFGSYPDPIVQQGWTLEYEMIFYILFSISITAHKIKTAIFITAALIVFLLVFGMSDIMLEFIYGMLAAYLCKNIKKVATIPLLLSLIGVAMLMVDKLSIYTQYRSIYYGLPCLLIFIGLLLTKELNLKKMEFIGDASYSIYLSHFIVIPVICKIFVKFYPSPSTSQSYLLLLICFVSSVTSGVIVYKYIESYLTRTMKSFSINKKITSNSN
ncbi:TPA: acyltransferase family protein [Klebsiella pneumoniae]